MRRIDTPEGEESDDHIVEHLKDVGFIVKQVDQTAPETAADGEDLILISATNSKYKTTNKYRDSKVPLMCLEGLNGGHAEDGWAPALSGLRRAW